jgi:hypothetical protein
MAKPRNTYVAIYLDKEGNVIGVEPPKDHKLIINNEPLSNHPMTVHGTKDIHVFLKNPSPCCIHSGCHLWCWC